MISPESGSPSVSGDYVICTAPICAGSTSTVADAPNCPLVGASAGLGDAGRAGPGAGSETGPADLVRMAGFGCRSIARINEFATSLMNDPVRDTSPHDTGPGRRCLPLEGAPPAQTAPRSPYGLLPRVRPAEWASAIAYAHRSELVNEGSCNRRPDCTRRHGAAAAFPMEDPRIDESNEQYT